MELTEIRKRKQQLEADILRSIQAFEDETTVLIERVNILQAVDPQEISVERTCDVEVLALVF
jgi:hypothetical protein